MNHFVYIQFINSGLPLDIIQLIHKIDKKLRIDTFFDHFVKKYNNTILWRSDMDYDNIFMDYEELEREKLDSHYYDDKINYKTCYNHYKKYYCLCEQSRNRLNRLKERGIVGTGELSLLIQRQLKY